MRKALSLFLLLGVAAASLAQQPPASGGQQSAKSAGSMPELQKSDIDMAKLENALYDALDNANESNRDDLVAILLTGVPGLNFTGQTKADLLRLNTGIAPTADVGDGDRLGVLGGDLAGYPNGRRLEDDVLLARSLNVTSFVATRRGDFAAAVELNREEVARWAALGSPRGEATGLRHLAVAHQYVGELDEAEQLCQQAMATWSWSTTARADTPVAASCAIRAS